MSFTLLAMRELTDPAARFLKADLGNRSATATTDEIVQDGFDEVM